MLTTTHAPDVLLLMAVGLLSTGVIAGLLAGLLGVGGGIVIVPVLFLLFTYLEVPSAIVMHMVVATSLATIIPISLSSAREHYRRGAVDMAVFRHWAPFMLIAAGIAAGLSGRLDSSYLQLLFGGIAIYVAATMIRGKTSAADAAPDGSTITPLGRGAAGGAPAGAHSRATLPAAALCSICRKRNTFDIATVCDHHHHVFALDQILNVVLEFEVFDRGTAFVGEPFFHLEKLFTHNAKKSLTRAKCPKKFGDTGRKFLRFTRQSVSFHPGQALQT